MYSCEYERISEINILNLILNSCKFGITPAWQEIKLKKFGLTTPHIDRLCVLVVRVSEYKSWGPGFDSRLYQIFWEVVGLKRGPLSLVSTIEELIGRNNSGFGLENREYGRGDPLRWPRDILYPQKLALTSPTCGGRSVGIVRLRTKTTEFCLIPHIKFNCNSLGSFGNKLWKWADRQTITNFSRYQFSVYFEQSDKQI
jgi:hypothetical protein